VGRSLESVCFAILVGMSCDFVLHFGHAYSSPPGTLSRHERTKQALIRMGPSVIAAAVTTIGAAAVMMFTKIVFFQRFAVILFYSLMMGLVGSVFVFLVITDIFGPAEPTVCVDSMLRCSRKTDELHSDTKKTSVQGTSPS
jgi:predicted RND superfamily exporter protein